ncbi:MAG: sialidase family protein, partial [Phycisphaerae bacterium]
CQCKDAENRAHPVVFYSDDDGLTWDRTMLETVAAHRADWPHADVRWQNYANEPTVVELLTGRLWMLIRTSQDRHYESFSDDGGVSWTTPKPSRFYGTITMPTFFRLQDGRILLFWCNTTPLPELDHTTQPELQEWERTGLTEDVFTNRDALHAAISEDDGQSWIGFRELTLNERRNDSDFRTSGGNSESLDKSVHQSQAVELPEGKILVSHGQHHLCRRLVIFDPAWLYETERSDDFRLGLGGWSTQLYVKSIVGNFRGFSGHCAYNRRPGPQLIPDPDGQPREVLQIARHADPRLVHEIQGAVWNFPAGRSGTLQLEIRLPQGSQGLRVCLLDRWFNPGDLVAHHFAQYVLEISGGGRINNTAATVVADTWQELQLEWTDGAPARFRIASTGDWIEVPLRAGSSNGISYLHLQSRAAAVDTVGVLLRKVAVHTGR